MYRFNQLDGRLTRLLEAALLIMESFAGFDHRYSYSMVGHSGDSAALPLVEYGHPPATRRDRLKVLEKMHAHAQYCSSGDSTLMSVEMGVQTLLQQPADEHVLFLISDANMRRYGIRPQDLASALVSDSRVSAFAILLASFDDEVGSRVSSSCCSQGTPEPERILCIWLTAPRHRRLSVSCRQTTASIAQMCPCYRMCFAPSLPRIWFPRDLDKLHCV